MTYIIQQICLSTTKPSVLPTIQEVIQNDGTISLIIGVVIGFGLAIALVFIICIIIMCVLLALKRKQMTLSDNSQHNTR